MRLSLVLVASCLVSLAGAFAPSSIHNNRKSLLRTVPSSSTTTRFLSNNDNDSNENITYDLANTFVNKKTVPAAVISWLQMTGMASADSPDWGVFEGRTGSILHPVMMASLFGLSLYTGFLGLQWRRQRTMGDTISSLKKQMPSLGSYKTIQAALDSDDASDMDVAALKAALPIEKEINDLTAERKELSAQGNRDKHYTQGAWIAFLGTAFAIEGPLNTYARAGKLFPGPHLYAGAGLVVCWAAAVACVPFMSKGNDTARTLHIASNVGGLALFAWQVSSGIPILLKVLEKTSWP